VRLVTVRAAQTQLSTLNLSNNCIGKIENLDGLPKLEVRTYAFVLVVNEHHIHGLRAAVHATDAAHGP